MKRKGTLEAKRIIENDMKDGVTEDTLFIRILFNTQGYHAFWVNEKNKHIIIKKKYYIYVFCVILVKSLNNYSEVIIY